jgi:glycosyltransferase involved in cell wall biosynthesis
LTEGEAGISVIIPVFNCERYLGEAIESVLSQTCRATEIFVIDDGSTDGTGHVARSYSPLVRYVFQRNLGAASARNRGAELAQKGFLSFLDADDVWLEDKLSRQMACFEQDPDLDMVFGYAEHFISPDIAEELAAKFHCPKQPMPAPGPATMLIRRQAFFQAGPFDAAYGCGESISWFAKAMDRGLRGRMVSEVMLRRRVHLNNISRVSRDVRDDYLRVVRDAVERRRRHKADGSLVGTDPGAES